jgi:hypothetical protein
MSGRRTGNSGEDVDADVLASAENECLNEATPKLASRGAYARCRNQITNDDGNICGGLANWPHRFLHSLYSGLDQIFLVCHWHSLGSELVLKG